MSELKIDRSGEVLHLSLNRPERANALSVNLVEQLIEAFENLGDARMVVLKGEGKSFCSGFDLSEMDSVSDGDLLLRFVRIEQLLQLVHHAPIPVLALAHQYAFGAGADLFASASMRVLAPDTKLRMPGLKFGLVLGTNRLSQLVGATDARDILIDTRIVTAEEALSGGLAAQISSIDDWPTIIECMHHRSTALSRVAMSKMLKRTTVDTRDADMAALVASASAPGLRQRVQNYVEEAAQERSSR